MLTPEQIQNILDRTKYKPGWNLESYQGRYEGPHLRIWSETIPDAFTPGAMARFDVHSPIPPMATEADLLEWLLWRIIRIESHEAREFFQIDGKPFADPHGPDADKDL